MRGSCVTRNYQEKSRAVYPGAGLGEENEVAVDNAGSEILAPYDNTHKVHVTNVKLLWRHINVDTLPGSFFFYWSQ